MKFFPSALNPALTIALYVLCIESSHAAPLYVCTANAAAGIVKSSGGIKAAIFQPNQNFKVEPGTDVPWLVFGTAPDMMGGSACTKDFDDMDNLYCDIGRWRFEMNRVSLRFVAAYTFGYWNGYDDIPTIVAGTCRSLSQKK